MTKDDAREELDSAGAERNALQDRVDPPATQAELAAAEERATDAFEAFEEADQAAEDAQGERDAARQEEQNACPTGPTVLPLTPDPGPLPPVITGPVPDVESSGDVE